MEIVRNPSLTSGETRPVLFATFVGHHDTHSLIRAAMFARAMEVELHVMAVEPGFTPVGDAELDDRRRDAARGSQRRAITRWCEEVLHDPLDGRVHVQFHPFVSAVIAQATELQPCLIVVPPYEGRRGSCVTAVVTACDVPVLVAHPRSMSRTVVAATDMADDQFPVLRQAADVVRRFEAPLVVVHNVGSNDDGEPDPEPEDLAEVTGRFGIVADVITTADSSPVHAILDQARSHDADLVVVGAHPHSWEDRILPGTVSTRVIDEADRSVLVMPLAR